jgi:hypothetical protein
LVVLAHRRQSLSGDLEQSRVAMEQEIGVGLVLEPADATPQLVELRKPEAIRALDQDRVAIRDIEAAFDDGGADEDVVAPGDELRSSIFSSSLGVHLAVANADAQVGQQVPGGARPRARSSGCGCGGRTPARRASARGRMASTTTFRRKSSTIVWIGCAVRRRASRSR